MGDKIQCIFAREKQITDCIKQLLGIVAQILGWRRYRSIYPAFRKLFFFLHIMAVQLGKTQRKAGKNKVNACRENTGELKDRIMLPKVSEEPEPGSRK